MENYRLSHCIETGKWIVLTCWANDDPISYDSIVDYRFISHDMAQTLANELNRVLGK